MSGSPLFLPAELADVQYVAVGVELRGDNPKFYPHSAALFRVNGKLKVLELSGDGSLKCSAEPRALSFAWAVPQIAEDQLMNIAAFCQTVADRNPRLHYAFRFLEDSLLADDGTSIVLRGKSVGLTCATFVLAIFQSRGRPLIKLDSWQIKSRDRDWQRQIAERIEKEPHRYGYGLSPSKIQAMKAEIPCFRYTPQQVVGSCMTGSHPTLFNAADPLAKNVWDSLKILWKMRIARGVLPPP